MCFFWIEQVGQLASQKLDSNPGKTLNLAKNPAKFLELGSLPGSLSKVTRLTIYPVKSWPGSRAKNNLTQVVSMTPCHMTL